MRPEDRPVEDEEVARLMSTVGRGVFDEARLASAGNTRDWCRRGPSRFQFSHALLESWFCCSGLRRLFRLRTHRWRRRRRALRRQLRVDHAGLVYNYLDHSRACAPLSAPESVGAGNKSTLGGPEAKLRFRHLTGTTCTESKRPVFAS